MHIASCKVATVPSGPLHVCAHAFRLFRYWPAGLSKPRQTRWWPAGSLAPTSAPAEPAYSPQQGQYTGKSVGVTCLFTSAGPVLTGKSLGVQTDEEEDKDGNVGQPAYSPQQG
eukprot:11003380-Karenia_brevis.AAC.1